MELKHRLFGFRKVNQQNIRKMLSKKILNSITEAVKNTIERAENPGTTLTMGPFLVIIIDKQIQITTYKEKFPCKEKANNN